MQREPAFKKLIKGLGFALFGNILSGIMVISIAPFIGVWAISCFAFLLTLVIYLSLMFTVGFNDGRREQSLVKNHRVDEPKKSGWLLYGLVPGAVFCVPVLILLLGIFGKAAVTGEYMFAFRFLCGAIQPLVNIGGFQGAAIAEYPLWFPLAGMGLYLIGSPLASAIGFRFGYDEDLRKNFMYENEKK
ncbi:MAG: hypothetical protein NC084_10685 [Bacteroides sp.]|nr:hypothetical protein [Eubacterium sp.]MCM1417534.1 hypothetical protein [Roseburia sp.]MCM1463164.1 hypothetical protein [Bacteroides sp.]